MKTDVQISDVMLTFAGGMYQHVREQIHTLRTAKSIHMRYCPVRPIGNFLCRDLGQVIAWRKLASYWGSLAMSTGSSLFLDKMEACTRAKRKAAGSYLQANNHVSVSCTWDVWWSFLLDDLPTLEMCSPWQPAVYFKSNGLERTWTERVCASWPRCRMQMSTRCFTFSK